MNNLLNTVDSIPLSQIKSVQHYPANILITTKNGGLFVTKQFSIGVKSIVGEFEKQPDVHTKPSTLNSFEMQEG